MMTRVFVTTAPTAPCWPVFGIVMPLRAGLFRTPSGVSPCGTCQAMSPRSRLIAVSNPYGGFTIGRPCTCVPLGGAAAGRSEEHTSELQSHHDLVCRLLLEKKNK